MSVDIYIIYSTTIAPDHTMVKKIAKSADFNLFRMKV